MESGTSVTNTIYVLSAVLLFGIPMIWCFIRFAYQTVQDIIGLSETKIAAIVALSLCGAILILNFTVSVEVVMQALQVEGIWFLILAIAPLCVFVAGIAAILFIDYHFRRKYESSNTMLPQKIWDIVRSIVDELNLSKAPGLYVISENRSPFCYGRTSKSAKLLLPKNFEEICLDATEGNKERAHSLMQFVIAHELSHIRNGDCAIMTWLTLFYRYLKVALVFAGMCVMFSVLMYWEQYSTRIVIVSFLLTTISLPCLKWVTANISRNRELAADARSSLLFDTKTLQGLVKRGSHDRASVFEYLTIFLSMQLQTFDSTVVFNKISDFGFGLVAKLGWAGTKINPHQGNNILKKWKKAFIFHPEINKRLEVLLQSNTASVKGGVKPRRG